MREITACPSEKWKQMSTEELDGVLQEELRKEQPDENVVLPILREIENREKEIPAGESAKVFQLRDQLSEHSYIPTKRSFRKGWISAIAAVAAIACIVVMALPRTVGAESILDVLFRWTESVFEFFSPEQDATNPPVEFVYETDNPGLQQLHDKLVELGVTENVVPTWLPNDLELVELNTNLLPDGCKVSAVFEKGEHVVSLSYRVCSEITSKFEKEDSSVEVFECANIEHFILENSQNLTVMWEYVNVECSLNTNLAKEDAYKIIMSIYRSDSH